VGPAASNPDAAKVSAEEELRRIEPVLAGLGARLEQVSIDTYLPETQLAAAARGVGFLNDIHGFPDPAVRDALAGFDCRLVVMHAVQAEGLATREAGLEPDQAVDTILAFFERRLADLEAAGVDRARIILDPGMGFFLGANPETSFRVLARLPELKALGLPLLVSVSRKSFLRAAARVSVEDAGPATLAGELWAAAAGADYIRTHDPRALRQAWAVWRATLDQDRR
jgi:dihydropteroate synthase type 1